MQTSRILLILILTHHSLHSNHKPLITILSKPVGRSHLYLSGGPKSRLKGLERGLKTLKVPYNYNPSTLNEIAPYVLVTMDPNAVRQMITLKKQNKIKRLLAGPNVMVCATDYRDLTRSTAVDLWLHPSPWPKIAWEEDMPTLKGKITIWPAGIDTAEWKPSLPKKPTKQILIYHKNVPSSLTTFVEQEVSRHGWQPKRISYGKFAQNSYKKMLDESACMIYLSFSESQGIALLEAWAMDVPTLVWNKQYLHAHGRKYSSISSCPYLTDATGRSWKHDYELTALLTNLDQLITQCTPRTWVLDNMTDRLCTIKLLTSLLPPEMYERIIPA